jgi:S-adenosylmethionine:tRNA ribosyltransferase-isomerase
MDRARNDIAVRSITDLPSLLSPEDLIVVNDAGTWPASIQARTERGEPVELRLASGICRPGAAVRAVLFGAGDWRTPTERRAPPPRVAPGEALFGPGIRLEIADASSDSGRILEIRLPADDLGLSALFSAGCPIQYSYMDRAVASWDVQTAFFGRPWAVEMPSAGRVLSFEVLGALTQAGIRIASLTHAAGFSSTGDPEIDRTLPWPEHYDLPAATAEAVQTTRQNGHRVVAIGTTVVRALEGAASAGTLEVGEGTTDLIIGPGHEPAVVGSVLSGLHEPTQSHFRVLEAFASRSMLVDALRVAASSGLRSHEFGDVCLVL